MQPRTSNRIDNRFTVIMTAQQTILLLVSIIVLSIVMQIAGIADFIANHTRAYLTARIFVVTHEVAPIGVIRQ